MKIEIVEEKDNPLLNRKELKIKIIHEGATPSRQEVKDALVALLGIEKDRVILNSYTSRFGVRESTGTARVYETKERALEVESKPVLVKNKLLSEKESEEGE
jgi:small subunit ribosomal protein S24e